MPLVPALQSGEREQTETAARFVLHSAHDRSHPRRSHCPHHRRLRAGGAARRVGRRHGGDARADPARRQAAASGRAADLEPAGRSAHRRRLRRDDRDIGREPRRIRAGAALHRGGRPREPSASRMRPARRSMPPSRRRRKACPSCRCAGSSAPTCSRIVRTGRSIDNPFGNDDPIVLLPAIKPDVALFHAPLADRDGNVWIGRDRELAMMAHAAAKTVVTVEKLHDGNLFDDPMPRCRHARRLLRGGDRGRAERRLAARARRSLRASTPRISPNMRAWPRPPKALRPTSTGTCMTGAPPDGFRNEELLADAIAGLIGDARHAAIGAASPIPAAAAMLARERGNGRPYVSLLGSRRQNFFTDGGRELFDCAGQGRIDVFFLSGGQIDGEGNINLVSVGDYEHPKVRFPGSFGSAYMYYVVPKVILFRLEHTRRTLVEKVDFISAPGTSPDNVYPPGRPDRAHHQPLPVRLRSRPQALPARERASRAYRRRGRRAHRLRFRPAGGRADDRRALPRDAAAAADRGRAAAHRGLSAVRRRSVRHAPLMRRKRPIAEAARAWSLCAAKAGPAARNVQGVYA